jgi:hypothetical protein
MSVVLAGGGIREGRPFHLLDDGRPLAELF